MNGVCCLSHMAWHVLIKNSTTAQHIPIHFCVKFEICEVKLLFLICVLLCKG